MDSDEFNYSLIQWVFLIVSTIAILFLLVFDFDKALSLPLIMIFGVIDLFIVLSVVGKSFSKTTLACQDEALGLPAGSIRALIALSLIIIFAIMAIFIFVELKPTVSLLQVPGNQSLVFSNGTIYSNPNGISVWNSETSQAQKDFATQVLTTVSTLVVALAGFYFGTKAVETAKGKSEKEKEEPQISISPSGKIQPKSNKKPLNIIVKTNPETEKVKATIKGDAKGKVEQSEDNKNIFTYTPSEEAKVVIIKFSWESNEKIKESLTIEFP